MISPLIRFLCLSAKSRWILPLSGSLALGIICLSGCSMARSGLVTTPSSFVFVANSGSATVSVLARDSSGALSPISTFPAGAGAEFMAVDAVHKFLYVSNQDANTLSAFSINTRTGMLTPASGSPFATGALPHGVVVDSAGKFAFVANQKDNSVSAFAINGSTGALNSVGGSPFTGINSPFGLALNSAGTVLFVTNLDAATVSAFQVERTTGALSPVAGSTLPTGTTPIGITADPAGNFLFVGDHMTSSISSFSIDSTSGMLTRLGGPPAAVSGCTQSCHTNPLRLAFHPASPFVYATNVGSNSISAFGMSNGVLSPISESRAGRHPFGLAIDPSGAFLYAVNKVDNSISGFSVDSMTGTLTALPGSPFAAGGSAPEGIVIVPAQ